MTTTQVNPYRYYPPKHAQFDTTSDAEILRLWQCCRDTYDIALQTGLPEQLIERRLHAALATRR